MLDDLDRGIVHALHVDGRASFRRIGEVLGVSTQTVTRRYQRLRRDAGLRVAALPPPGAPRREQWLVRLTTTPAGAQVVAEAIARRPDTSWVRLLAGGTEIVAIASHGRTGSPPPLLQDLPKAASVGTVAAHLVLHTYRGGPTTWPGRFRALTPEQEDALRPARASTASSRAGGEEERRLRVVLGRDGRTSLADLAALTGWSPATVARRLVELRAAGELFLDVDLDDTVLGVGTRALLWLAVAPRDLDAVARELAGHDALAYVAAITGTHALVAQVLATDPEDLHRYLTGPLAAVRAVHDVETSPVLRTVKSL
ncbi:Lrp/AsnC family transcriptional regulator [Pseudonocardia sp. CA-107938]|uniref:Lrp/AsnC family transcriptional regulator n=1 Tax=Pseudonocardia sp. CA-107938 TaxID=3240021 RepID=UPI003D8B57C6